MDANGISSPAGITDAPMITSITDAPGSHRLKVRRPGIVLKPSNSRVVLRPFEPTNPQRIERILARLISLSEEEVDRLLGEVMSEFHNRHQKTRHFFLHRFEQVKQHLLTDQQ